MPTYTFLSPFSSKYEDRPSIYTYKKITPRIRVSIDDYNPSREWRTQNTQKKTKEAEEGRPNPKIHEYKRSKSVLNLTTINSALERPIFRDAREGFFDDLPARNETKSQSPIKLGTRGQESSVFDSSPASVYKSVDPPSNVLINDLDTSKRDKKEDYNVQLDINGYKPKEIQIKTRGYTLEIFGKMDYARPLKDDYGLIKREFRRSYQLPMDCCPEKIKSEIDADGKVLYVKCPYK